METDEKSCEIGVESNEEEDNEQLNQCITRHHIR